MAAPTNSLVTGAMVGIREDLQEAMEMIDPDETPFFSNAPKGSTQRAYDWLDDAYLPVDTTARPEGNDAPRQALGQPTRYDNVCEILQRDGNVSRTSNDSNTAGRGKEKSYQKLMKGIELRRDWETVLLMDQAKKTTDPREVAALPAWITQGSVGATTGAFPTGDGTDLPVSGDARALSLNLITDAQKQAWDSGGRPTYMLMNSSQKVAFSALSVPSGTNSTNVVNTNEARGAMASIIGAVDLFVTDFGNLSVVVDRFCPTDRIYGLDRRKYKVTTFPGGGFISEDLAKTGDSEHFHVVNEGGLKIGSPKAHWAIYDLN